MFNSFLQIDGIPGESTDKKHPNWIEPLSYSFGATQAIGSAVSTGARSSGRVDIQDFSIMKELDVASTKLFLACAQGKSIKKMTLEICRADANQTPYMKYDMQDALVTSYQPSGQAGGNTPTESVTFNPAKITMTYTKTNHATGEPEGQPPATWDQSTNTGS